MSDDYGKVKEESKCDGEDFTTFEGFCMVFNRSLWPIIGSVFHPVYMMINAKILGQMNPSSDCVADSTDIECVKPDTYLAAFGMGSSTMSILILAPLTCFCIGLSNILP